MPALTETRASNPTTLATWTRHVFNTGLAFRSMHTIVSHAPATVAYAGAHLGTGVAHRLMRATTAALVANFRGAFPDLDARTLDTLALRTYRSYARDVVDFFRAVPLAADASLALFDRVHEHEALFRAQMAHGRGVILVTGHFGNWEMGSVLMRALGLPLTIVAMREASEDINRLRLEFRQRLGADTLEVRQSIDTALQIRRRLSENRIVAMLMDRHVDRDRVAVTFFGRRAFFLKTPPLLAYLTGAPLLPCAVLRLPTGRFSVRPGEPILVARDLDRETAVQQAAQRFATQLEALIRQTPHHWYQFYPYWEAQDAVALGGA